MIGLLSFGGPAAQIALMHKEIVEQRRWLSEQQFLNGLSFCMLLPGPEAMQLATYAGWRKHGIIGGLFAGLLFILPGAIIIAIIASAYSFYGNVPLVSALFTGIQAAVLAIVMQALLRLASKALAQPWHRAIAAMAFIGIFFLSIPFPLIVLAAGLAGLLVGAHNNDTPAAAIRISTQHTLLTVVSWLALWLLPLFALYALGAPTILQEIALFFSTLAVVTFGGAYAVLAFMAQEVVGQFGWLTAGEMVDALGLAETTPGPLILVTQFVAFLAAFKEGGIILAIQGAGVALWATFAPCFLWIFAFAPYIDWISSQPRLNGALRAITAAVVGVILNLSIWLALHVVFTSVTQTQFGWITVWIPDPSTLQWLPLMLFLLSLTMIFRYGWSVIKILLLSATLGALASMLVA